MKIEDVTKGPLVESIEYDLPWSAYADEPAINASTLKAGYKGKSISMLALKHAFEHGREDTEAMLFGRCLHCLMFEPQEFEKRYAAFDGRRDKRSADYQKFLKDHEGAEVLKKSGQYSWDDAMHAAASFLRSAELERLTEHGKGEVTLMSAHMGIQLRARLDWLSTSCQILTDMKTSRDVSEEAFGRQFFSLKYDLQLGFYRWMFRKLFNRDWPTKVVAVENKPPYEIVIYDIPDAVLDSGQDKAFDMLGRVRKCLNDGEWPGVGTEASLPLFIPQWEMEAEVEWTEDVA